jgi:hypothetical protein
MKPVGFQAVFAVSGLFPKDTLGVFVGFLKICFGCSNSRGVFPRENEVFEQDFLPNGFLR